MTRVVFLDALGTLVDLEPPWEHLRAVVPDRLGEERLRRAVRAEMDYYRAHAHEGADERSLTELRERCAAMLSADLGVEVSAPELVAAMRMRAYPDAEPALRALSEAGVPRIVVSNWDRSLPEVLERCGLAPLLDGSFSSAQAGAPKPDPAIFRLALEAAGCEPADALHVGDSPEEDLRGAAAAGVRALLIAREPGAEPADGGTVISSLGEIVEHL